ncbi:MAG: YiiX/YebB-like N1pC/P60 family cysteine hydrolase, partial [Limisphaerales bacterium]
HSPAAMLQVDSNPGGVGPAGDVGCGADRFEWLQELVEGLDALEVRLDRGVILPAAIRRGYLTPDEESQVRQMLLSYRNLRLAAYDLILENSDYAARETESCRHRSFLVAFVAALALYAKSLRIIQLVEHAPLLRAKLNEPEPRLEIGEGFFDDVLRGYSSLSHYRLMREADRYWRKERRRMIRLGFAADSQLAWAMGLVRRQRRIVRNRLLHVLWQRLRRDWRGFVQTVFRPARGVVYGLQAIVGETFAQARLKYDYTPGITESVLEELRGQLRPGDILLVRTEGKVTTALLPGFWAHAAIALGTGEQRVGLELTEEMRGRLAVGGRFGHVLEGLAPRVQINPLEQCLAADHVLVLRPNVSAQSMQEALQEALGHFGLPYDFEFDFTLNTRVVCTGLVYRSFHGRGTIRFELIRRLGRYTLSGDDLVNQAVDAWSQTGGDPARAPFEFVALALHRRRGGVQFVPARRIPAVLGRIRRGWRPLRG